MCGVVRITNVALCTTCVAALLLLLRQLYNSGTLTQRNGGKNYHCHIATATGRRACPTNNQQLQYRVSSKPANRVHVNLLALRQRWPAELWPSRSSHSSRNAQCVLWAYVRVCVCVCLCSAVQKRLVVTQSARERIANV